MIKHVVSWKLASESVEERQAQTDRIVSELQSLMGVVPSIRALSAGATVVRGPQHWDIGVVVDFDDVAGLDAYQENPDHKAAGSYIRSVTSEQAVVDFEV